MLEISKKFTSRAVSNFILFFQGMIYTITDVKDLHDWMADHMRKHPLYEQVIQSELVRVVMKLHKTRIKLKFIVPLF